MTTTPNYGLRKPSYEEHGDVADLNYNMDIVDGALAEKMPNPTNTGTQDQILRSDGQGGSHWDNAASQEEVGAAVTEWLEENVPSGTTVVVDRSLSIDGAAADAKKTGDALSDLNSAIKELGIEFSTNQVFTERVSEDITAKFYPVSLKAGEYFFYLSDITPSTGVKLNVRLTKAATTVGTDNIKPIVDGLNTHTSNEITRFSITTEEANQILYIGLLAKHQSQVSYSVCLFGQPLVQFDHKEIDDKVNLIDEKTKTYSANVALFEHGAYNHVNTKTASTTALCTTDYINDNVLAAKANDGYNMRIKAYNKQTSAFIGTWDGTKFTNGVAGSVVTSFDFTKYDYKYKMNFYRTDAGIILLSEAENALFLSYVDTTLSKKYKAADSYITGEKISEIQEKISNIEGADAVEIHPVIEQGAISSVNGNNESSSIRIRTQDKIMLDADYRISIESTQSYQIMIYHDTTYSASDSYLSYSSDTTILKKSSNTYFRICIQQSNETITPSDCALKIERSTELINIGFLMEITKPINKNCLSASHRGNNSITQENHNKLEGYIQAAKDGFDYGECDLNETSDGILVCCHDATFEDATTGNTVTIATSTYAELITHNYYGGKIAKFEDIVKVCKLYGMGISIDQLGTASIIRKACDIIKKYQMIENTIWGFGIGADEAIGIVKGKFSKATFAIVSASATLEQIITYANSVAAGGYSCYADVPYTITTPEGLGEAALDLNDNVFFRPWVIDNISTMKNYMPYAKMITSNKYNMKDVYKTYLM